MIRRVLADRGLALPGLGDDVEVRAVTDGLDVAPWTPREVLLVSADEARLAVAGRLGIHRLVVAAPDATAAAVAELVAELDRCP